MIGFGREGGCHAVPRIASLRSLPPIGLLMKTSRPAVSQRAAHISTARALASSFSASRVRHSTPPRTGKAATAPAEPRAHVGLNPSWRAAVSRHALSI
jgi:hypothetical protein